MSEITERLSLGQISICNCLIKTPEVRYHDKNCKYRIMDDAIEYIKELESENTILKDRLDASEHIAKSIAKAASEEAEALRLVLIERNELLIKNAKLQPSGIEVACHADLLISYDKLVRENEELNRDGERLEFIFKNYNRLELIKFEDVFWTNLNHHDDSFSSMREAIDNAMRSEK